MPERVYVSAIYAESVSPSLDGVTVNLTKAGVRALMPSESGGIMIQVYMTFFFLDAQGGDYPIRLRATDKDAKIVLDRPVRTLRQPPGTSTFAFAIELADMKLPLGLLQLGILVRDAPRAILPLQIGVAPGNIHG